MKKIVLTFFGFLTASVVMAQVTNHNIALPKQAHSSFSKRVQLKNGIAIQIPSNWIQIPQKEITSRNELLKAFQKKAGTLVQYDFGFQQKTDSWFTDPQILIAIHQTGKLPESAFKKYKTIDDAFRRGSEKINKASVGAVISNGEIFYEPTSRILWASAQVDGARGMSKVLSGTILTEEGAISIIGYSALNNKESLDLIERIIRNIILPKHLIYRDQT